MTKKDILKTMCGTALLLSVLTSNTRVFAEEVNSPDLPETVNTAPSTESESVDPSNLDVDKTPAVDTETVPSAVTSDENSSALPSEKDSKTTSTLLSEKESETTSTLPSEKESESTLAKETQAVLPKEFSTDFTAFDDATMERANWANGNPFNCLWVPENAVLQDGKLTLTITEDGKGGYHSGEWRTRQTFGYGKFEVRMKPIKNPGTVSSFFTYTGPYDGTPWDEVDIEFLGKDTTKVQFNYYTNGKGGNEYIHDLGFDAAEDFHTYAFEWQKDYITWYVDGKAVYTATKNIPVTPGKIMMNAWPGIGVDEWLEPFDGKTPLVATYDWIRYTATEPKKEEVTPVVPIPDSGNATKVLKPVKQSTPRVILVQTQAEPQPQTQSELHSETKLIEVSQGAPEVKTQLPSKEIGETRRQQVLPKTGVKESILLKLIGMVSLVASLIVAYLDFNKIKD